MTKPLVQSTGRRKTAIARVRLRPGTGKILCNGRPLVEYFPVPTHAQHATEPLRLSETADVYDVDVARVPVGSSVATEVAAS